MNRGAGTRNGGGAGAATVFIGLGSNVGDRHDHLAHALRVLAERDRLIAVSSVYETEPVGFLDQGRFLNAVAALDTWRRPAELLEAAREIERERGRIRAFPNAPRTLDMDLLLYGDETVDWEGLIIPHPRMRERAFVLVPLLELAPDLVEPGTGRSYETYLRELAGEEPEGGEDPEEPGGGGGQLGLRALRQLGLRRVMGGEELLKGGDAQE